MDEVRLTLKSFMQLCKLLIDVEAEKERLRKIVVMQNRALENLTGAAESSYIKGHKEWKRASTADLDMRDKHSHAFWPPLGMIP